MRFLHGIISSADVNLSQFWETVEDRGAWCAAVRGSQRADWATAETPPFGLDFGVLFPEALIASRSQVKSNENYQSWVFPKQGDAENAYSS